MTPEHMRHALATARTCCELVTAAAEAVALERELTHGPDSHVRALFDVARVAREQRHALRAILEHLEGEGEDA